MNYFANYLCVKFNYHCAIRILGYIGDSIELRVYTLEPNFLGSNLSSDST